MILPGVWSHTEGTDHQNSVILARIFCLLIIISVCDPPVPCGCVYKLKDFRHDKLHFNSKYSMWWCWVLIETTLLERFQSTSNGNMTFVQALYCLKLLAIVAELLYGSTQPFSFSEVFLEQAAISFLFLCLFVCWFGKGLVSCVVFPGKQKALQRLIPPWHFKSMWLWLNI